MLILPYSPFQKNETLETWHNRLLSNWSRLFNWKGAGAYPQSSKSFKWFQENIDLAYIYQLSKFGGWMCYGSKDIFKNAPWLMYEYSSWRHRFGKSCDDWKHKKLEYLQNRAEVTFKCKRPIKLYWGKEGSIGSETVFCYYYYQALLSAYLGKRKKKTTLLGINTVHLMHYPCWFNLEIFSTRKRFFNILVAINTMACFWS